MIEPKNLPSNPVSNYDKMADQPMTSSNHISNTKAMLNAEKHYKLIIPSTEKDRNAVFIGINGYAFNIPRDVEVVVPESVYKSIIEAKHTVYDIDEESSKKSDGAVIRTKTVARFPMQASEITDPKEKERLLKEQARKQVAAKNADSQDKSE